MARINKKLVDDLSPDVGREIMVWDDDVRGFGVRVRPSGIKSYVAVYRHGGRKRWFTIGEHGSPWTPDKARAKAVAILLAAKNGADPQEEKVKAREKVETVGELIDLYLRDGPIDKPNKRPRSWETDRSNLNRHVRVLIGSRTAASLTARDIAELQRNVASGKSRQDIKTKKRGRAIVRGGAGIAARAVTALAAMLQWAEKRELIAKNPARGIQKFKSEPRERYLTREELVKLLDTIDAMVASQQLKSADAAIFKLLIYTGCRKLEIVGLRWDEIDFPRNSIALSNDRSKTGAKRVPLNSMAIAELKKIPRRADHVFPAAKGQSGHVANIHHVWERVRAEAGMPDLRMHDLRHSFASFAVETGESLYILQRALGHKKAVTTQRYAHLRDDPLQEMVERVGAFIESARHPRLRAKTPQP